MLITLSWILYCVLQILYALYVCRYLVLCFVYMYVCVRHLIAFVNIKLLFISFYFSSFLLLNIFISSVVSLLLFCPRMNGVWWRANEKEKQLIEIKLKILWDFWRKRREKKTWNSTTIENFDVKMLQFIINIVIINHECLFVNCLTTVQQQQHFSYYIYSYKY